MTSQKQALIDRFWAEKFEEIGERYRPFTGRMIGVMGEFQQLAFRGRKDDGVESLQESDGGATWEAGKNVDYDLDVDDQTRIRFLITRTVDSVEASSHRLYYSLNGAGFIRVTRDSDVVRTVDTIHYLNHDASTDFTGRIGTGTWSDITNECLVTGIRTGDWTQNVNQDMEPEWCVKLVADDVNDDDKVRLRMQATLGAVYGTYANIPELTVVKSIPSMIITSP